jgi:hypothetical protein
MITKEELKHYRELGYKDIVLDINKNPSSRKDFICPYWVANLEENQAYLIDKTAIR